jgi:hypothetical protein
MGVSGYAAGGFIDGLAQVMREQMLRAAEEQQREEQRRQFDVTTAQRGREHADEVEFRNRSLQQQGDLAESARRDRNNAAGLEDMYRQRGIMDEEAQQQGMAALETDESLPQSVRTVVGLRRRGVTGVSPDDLEDPAARDKREVDRARAIAEAQYGTAARYRAPSSGGGGQLSPSMEANVLNRLSNQWSQASAPSRELDRQLSLMDAGLNAARRGDMAQGAQTVLVTFQKILDPPSVVRESEYMRSAAGQSLMNRVSGAMEQLAVGGAGIRLPELEKFAQLAREAAAAQKQYVPAMQDRLGRTADRYGIPRELLFDAQPSTPEPSPQGEAPAASQPGTRQVGEVRVFPNGRRGRWNGQAWEQIP